MRTIMRSSRFSIDNRAPSRPYFAMPGPTTLQPEYDHTVEEKALRDAGVLGRGGGMGSVLYAIDYTHLPPEGIRTIQLIVQGGPFPFPSKDGSKFGNKFGDLPAYSQDYLEFTVPTPGATDRGGRRIVARRSGVLFFTACHYERVQGPGSPAAKKAMTATLDPAWQNGFYVITGMPSDLRRQLRTALAKL